MDIQKAHQINETKDAPSTASMIRKEIWPAVEVPPKGYPSGKEYFGKVSDTFKNLSIRSRTLMIYNAALVVVGASLAATFSDMGAATIAVFSAMGGIFASLYGFSYLRMKFNKARGDDFRKLSDLSGELESGTRP